MNMLGWFIGKVLAIPVFVIGFVCINIMSFTESILYGFVDNKVIEKMMENDSFIAFIITALFTSIFWVFVTGCIVNYGPSYYYFYFGK